MHGRAIHQCSCSSVWLEHRSYEIFEDSRRSAVRARTGTMKMYIL
jgi:hypothetical protein